MQTLTTKKLDSRANKPTDRSNSGAVRKENCYQMVKRSSRKKRKNKDQQPRYRRCYHSIQTNKKANSGGSDFGYRSRKGLTPLHLHAWKLVEREEAWNMMNQNNRRQPLFSLQARERKALRLTLRFFSRRISVSWFAPGRTLINPSPPPCMEAGGEGGG